MASSGAAVKDWAALQQLPSSTLSTVNTLLEKVRAANVDSLTVLLLGKSSVGKSSTVNSLFNERVCTVNAFQAETARPVEVCRLAAGIKVSVIDTPGLIESGKINRTSLASILHFLVGRKIDCVLYVDRLDAYRVDTIDRLVIRAITQAFGKQIWSRAVVALTHAQMQPSDGRSYVDYVAARSLHLTQLIRKEGAPVDLPVALVENSGRCRTNEANQKILPDGREMLGSLLTAIAEEATKEGKRVEVTEKLARGPNPNSRFKLLIPIILLAQFFLVVRPMQKAINDDFGREGRRQLSWELRAEEFKKSSSGDWLRKQLETGENPENLEGLESLVDHTSKPDLSFFRGR